MFKHNKPFISDAVLMQILQMTGRSFELVFETCVSAVQLQLNDRTYLQAQFGSKGY
jgi:hypothetical protein